MRTTDARAERKLEYCPAEKKNISVMAAALGGQGRKIQSRLTIIFHCKDKTGGGDRGQRRGCQQCTLGKGGEENCHYPYLKHLPGGWSPRLNTRSLPVESGEDWKRCNEAADGAFKQMHAGFEVTEIENPHSGPGDRGASVPEDC